MTRRTLMQSIVAGMTVLLGRKLVANGCEPVIQSNESKVAAMEIRNSSAILIMSVSSGGHVTFGEGVTPNEAARAFAECLPRECRRVTQGKDVDGTQPTS